VTLLGRCQTILVEDLVDEGQKGSQDRFGSAGGLPEGGRFGVGDDLLDGAEVEVVMCGRLPQAQLAGQDAATDFRPQLHVGKHSCLPLSEPKAALSIPGWRLGALHFWVGTALHFLVGKYNWLNPEHRCPLPLARHLQILDL
jgi:hypothetical protein